MPVPYEETELLPLVTDDDVERRVADQIGRANARQLWLLFLDELDLQLPLLIPVDGLPAQPDGDHSERVIETVRDLMDEIGASSVVVVLERYGPTTLTAQDAAWVRFLRAGFAAAGVTLRAQLLSHRTGVRWIADDEVTDNAG
jgi:hypothetical protein